MNRHELHTLTAALLLIVSPLAFTGCEVPLIGGMIESKSDRQDRRDAEADAIRNAPVQTEVLYVIEGDFIGPFITRGTNTFQPTIRFGVNNQGYDGGQIVAVVSADVPGIGIDSIPPVGPGFWRLTGEGRIKIEGTTPYYAGFATIDGASIRLANGVLMTGGSVYPVRRPVGGVLP